MRSVEFHPKAEEEFFEPEEDRLGPASPTGLFLLGGFLQVVERPHSVAVVLADPAFEQAEGVGAVFERSPDEIGVKDVKPAAGP